MEKQSTGITDMESITLSLLIGSIMETRLSITDFLLFRLCDYVHLQKPINQLVAKNARVLAIGCGNAVFSTDM